MILSALDLSSEDVSIPRLSINVDRRVEEDTIAGRPGLGEAGAAAPAPVSGTASEPTNISHRTAEDQLKLTKNQLNINRPKSVVEQQNIKYGLQNRRSHLVLSAQRSLKFIIFNTKSVRIFNKEIHHLKCKFHHCCLYKPASSRAPRADHCASVIRCLHQNS